MTSVVHRRNPRETPDATVIAVNATPLTRRNCRVPSASARQSFKIEFARMPMAIASAATCDATPPAALLAIEIIKASTSVNLGSARSSVSREASWLRRCGLRHKACRRRTSRRVGITASDAAAASRTGNSQQRCGIFHGAERCVRSQSSLRSAA